MITSFDNIINDRGSKYTVSGSAASTRAEVQQILKELKRVKRFARATHNSWAVLSSTDGPIKNDDGEAGAGMIILRMLERAELYDHIIIVTRWFGWTKLGGDRFRRIQDCTRHYLDKGKF